MNRSIPIGCVSSRRTDTDRAYAEAPSPENGPTEYTSRANCPVRSTDWSVKRSDSIRPVTVELRPLLGMLDESFVRKHPFVGRRPLDKHPITRVMPTR